MPGRLGQDMAELNFITEAQTNARPRRSERADSGGEKCEGRRQILRGSQSSSRAEFFYVAEPQKGVHAEERGGCQVVKGAGLRTLSRRCSRVRLPSPA
jgi:hypothetical protein